MATVAAAPEQTEPVKLEPVSGEEQGEKQRSCRDVLSAAAEWYTAAKDYVPEAAKPLVAKVEAKVGEKIQQYPDTVKRVETFMDDRVIPAAEAAAKKVAAKTQEVLANETVQTRVIEPGRAAVKQVVDKTNEFLASEKGQALKTKATEVVHAVNEKASQLKAAASAKSTEIRGKIDNSYTRVVEAGLDAAGHVHDAAAAAKAFERSASHFIKEKWQSPPTKSDIHDSAVALANFVDGIVDKALPADEEADSADSADSAAATDAAEAEAADSVDQAPSDEGATSSKVSEQSIAKLARNIAGKVSFRMKKRVAKQLEAAKGNLKLRTEKILHSTNLIQYAQTIAADERYAKLNNVLTEAANVVQNSGKGLVRTIADKAAGANVTGIELLQRGEKTAKLAIVTTGEVSEKCRAYAQGLAAKIRQRIQELEEQRAKGDGSGDAAEAKVDESERAKLSDALAEYVRVTTETGAATLFVFRSELNQVLTYAFTATKPTLDSARSVVETSAAWTALTQWKDEAEARRQKIAAAIEEAKQKGAAAVNDAKAKGTAAVEEAKAKGAATVEELKKKGADAVRRATTWTNLAFNELASTGPIASGVHALPTSFQRALGYVLQRIARSGTADEPVVEIEDVVDAVVVAETVNDDAVVVKAEEPEPAAAAVAVAAPVEADNDNAVDTQGAETEALDESAADAPVTFELDDQSNAEWYFSVDGVDPEEVGSSSEEVYEGED